MKLICSSCKQELPVAMFSRKSGSKRGYHYKCKDCHNEYVRTQWYPNNRLKQIAASAKWKERNKPKVLAQRYGATENEVVRVLSQDRCEICGASESLVVDHNHDTGALRGALCSHCNWGLGQFKDSLDILKSAMVYLQKYSSAIAQ